MKTIRLLMLVLGVGYSWMAYSQKMDFSEYEHDFHTIVDTNGGVWHDFYFMNSGDKPLVVKEILVSCGCMASEWSREKLLPGEKAFIRLSYNPVNRHETDFFGVAEVYTNAGVINLKMQGVVVRTPQKLPIDYQLTQEERKVRKRSVKREENHFEKILERMRGEMLQSMNVVANDTDVLGEISSLRRDGSWPDIDYKCYFRSNWEPMRHLNRVYTMAVAYVDPESKYCGNDTLFIAIQDALGYWLRSTPECHNWWFNQIAVPQCLGNILVLLDVGDKQLSSEVRNGLFRLMALPDPQKWTGANKQDIALHHLQRGCLLRSDSIVRFAAEQMFYPVRFTTQEGVQADMSYHQHGNQLYVGGYGTVFVGCITRTAKWLHGTPYALQEEQLVLFSRFMRETYLNVFRGGYIDHSVLGRGVSRQGVTRQRGMVGLLDRMKELDPSFASEYEQAKARFQGYADSCRNDYSRVYWRSDYALHNRKAFDFSVRTSSVRTRKIEAGNGENLKGTLLSDGATVLRMKGDEYGDIFPLWNWNHIPGVTAPYEMSNLMPGAWGTSGKSVFSGGVSDGSYSVMAYQMGEFGIEAKKAWFMFDREVVCLGAGINFEKSGKVITTVEQCRASQIQSEGNKLLFRNILYYFPANDKVVTTSQQRAGSWADINYNYSSAKLSGMMAHIYVDHGEQPADGKYAYVLVPGISNIEEYDTTSVSILRNDTLVQAVYQREKDVLQLVCYDAVRFEELGMSLECDIPCVMMIRGVKSPNPVLYIADPMQDKKTAKVVYKDAGHEISRQIGLPEGGMKGSSVKIEIK